MKLHPLGHLPLPLTPDLRDWPVGKLVALLKSTGVHARAWADPENVLDQGDTPHCVGDGWAQWGNTLPIDDRYRQADADAIYYESLVCGHQPRGEDGSTARWGAMAMKKRGRLSGYAFGGYDAALNWLLNYGPVVIAVNWYEGMDRPTHCRGIVHVKGAVRGSHELLWCKHTKSYDGLLNSWGDGWAVHGRCLIPCADQRFLLDRDGGSAVTATELPLH